MIIEINVINWMGRPWNRHIHLSPISWVYAAAYLFPHLFEIDDPQAAMRETLQR